MNVQIIKFFISNQRLWRYTSGVITEDSILKFEFVFKTADWDAVETKTVVFSYRGQNYETTLDENNQCFVCKEALYAPYFKVSVYGGGIITNTVTIPVEPVSSSEYKQLYDILENKSDVEHKHDERYYTENEAEDRFISEEELPQIATDDDCIDLLNELQISQPISDNNGVLFVDNENKIFILWGDKQYGTWIYKIKWSWFNYRINW